MTDVLQRFHRTLVEEIQSKRPSYLEGPFTVAEIYQNLVPYGSHRDRIGVEMNGDYEDALLRLLAGEGGFLRLDSEHALRELREELESPHPNTGLYREFAAVDVRLAQEYVDATGPVAVDGLAPDGPVASMDDLAPDPVESARNGSEGVGQPARDPEAPGESGESRSSGDGEACRWCRATMPDHPNLNFCPFCGTDTRLLPCPQCGEEILPDWRFCVTCGTGVEG